MFLEWKKKKTYEQIWTLEEKLPLHYAITHMDFAKNYACKTVATFTKHIIADVKELDPALIECVHDWTDSKTSQYRNKTVFNMVANHQNTIGIKVIWNYTFRPGTEKGPRDGLRSWSDRKSCRSRRIRFLCLDQVSRLHNAQFKNNCVLVRDESCCCEGCLLDNFRYEWRKGGVSMNESAGKKQRFPPSLRRRPVWR